MEPELPLGLRGVMECEPLTRLHDSMFMSWRSAERVLRFFQPRLLLARVGLVERVALERHGKHERTWYAEDDERTACPMALRV